jgi:hypothetical protein
VINIWLSLLEGCFIAKGAPLLIGFAKDAKTRAERRRPIRWWPSFSQAGLGFK